MELVCAEDIEWITQYKTDETLSFLSCFLNKNSLRSSVALLLILLYQLIINPCFDNYIPSMLKRITSFLLIYNNIFCYNSCL